MLTPRRTCWLVAVLAAGAAPSWAVGGEALILTADRAVHAHAVRIDARGRVTALDEAGSESARYAADDVLLVRMEARPRRLPARTWVLLDDGQRFSGTALRVEGQEIVLRGADGSALTFPRSRVSSLFFNTGRPTPGTPPETEVRIVRANGDVLEVPFAELTDAGLVAEIDLDLDPIVLPLHLLRAITWPAALRGSEENDGAGRTQLIELRTGERIAGRITSLDAGALTVETDAGVRSTPAREVSSIWFRGRPGRVVDERLSDDDVTDDRPRYRRGRNALGNPLRIGQRVFDQGLGLRGPAEVSLDVPGGARWFFAEVGADADAAAFARVVCEIRVDDAEPAFRETFVPGEEARAVAVAVEGATRITLRVAPDGDDPTGCLGGFADAMFIEAD